jgi:hypothetical protein
VPIVGKHSAGTEHRSGCFYFYLNRILPVACHVSSRSLSSSVTKSFQTAIHNFNELAKIVRKNFVFLFLKVVLSFPPWGEVAVYRFKQFNK